MKQLTAEQIVDQLAGLADKIRQDVIKDLLGDLEDFAKVAIPEERAGFRAAIEVIQANYVM